MSSLQQYLAGEVALWLQIGCGEEVTFLGCHNLTGVSVPRGDTNPTYCRVAKNKFEVQRTWRGAPGLGSMTLVGYETLLMELQEIPCAFTLYAHHATGGVDESFSNYDFSYVYDGTEVTSEDTDTQAVGMNPDEQTAISVSFPCTFRTRAKIKKLAASSKDLSGINTNDFTDIHFVDEASCDSLGNFETLGCKIGFITTEGPTAQIIKTTGGGANWSAIASPFTDADDDIVAVSGQGDTVIAVNGTSAAYAYSSDTGVTFTEVSGIAKVLTRAYFINTANIWFVGHDGYIFQSTNGGVGVTTKDAGTATSSLLHDISFADSRLGYAVGNDNAFVRTIDGGEVWSAVTGPAAAVYPNDLYRVAAVPGTDVVFIGDESGNVWRSSDRGATWALSLSNTNLVGGIVGIEISDCNTITVLGNDQDPYFYSGASVDGVIYRSINGGEIWESVDLESNNGMNGIAMCGPNRFWAVGEAGEVQLVTGEVLT